MDEKNNNKETAPSRWNGIAIDLLAIGSFASLVYGCWMVYPAAGFIVGGGLGLMGAVLIARGAA